MAMDQPYPADSDHSDSDRRFLYRLAGLIVATGLMFATWPFIDSLNPSAEVSPPIAWVDMTKIALGERKTAYMGNWPVFIFHRTPEDIAAARADDNTPMPSPEQDRHRVVRDEWLIVIGVDEQGWPLRGQKTGERRGDWGGWRSCCEHRMYDLSGRIRTKWGTINLVVPPYRFEGDKWIVIGEAS